MISETERIKVKLINIFGKFLRTNLINKKSTLLNLSATHTEAFSKLVDETSFSFALILKAVISSIFSKYLYFWNTNLLRM